MNKKVLITGGSRGIGAEMVRLFSENGFLVAFTYSKSKKEAKKLEDGFGAKGFCVNFENTEEVIRFANELKEKFGEIDVLINNAGVSSYGVFQDVTEEEFLKIFHINFESMFFLTKEILPSMISRRCGCVINISSIWGQTGASCEVLYSSSKAAVIGFTKALAKEVAPSLVRVNCIAPGAVDTDMLALFSESEKRELAEEIPAGRLSTPREIAEVALHLARCETISLTGQVIAVNGGLYC